MWGVDIAGSLGATGDVGGLAAILDLTGESGTVSGAHFPAYDGNGNVMALVSEMSGYAYLTARYEYDPFGNELRRSGSHAENNPWRFSTKWTDWESGLSCYGFRFHIPEEGAPDMGRFCQMRKSVLFMIASGFVGMMVLCSCSVGKVIEVHHKAVTEGYHKLPTAKSLNEKFPAWSFITHFNIPTRGKQDDEKTWNTLTYAYGRYELHFVQQVQLDRSGVKIAKSLDEGRLLIKEIKTVHGDRSAPGTRYDDLQVWVEGEKLKKLVDSGWDFSVIGLALNKKPIENVDWLRLYNNRTHPLQARTEELR
ncbi:MAG TPA: hypothetical protein VMN36_00945 [Verrucomicrobiales bacterium]|nr:hypothetical protein [Verrucomicrobiales bacterium]